MCAFDYLKWRRDRYWRWRRAGACTDCGEPCAPFHKCFRHRVMQSKWKRRRRRQGLYK